MMLGLRMLRIFEMLQSEHLAISQGGNWMKRVVEGMDVVKKVESFGSQSGKTSKKIIIADCGQC